MRTLRMMVLVVLAILALLVLGFGAYVRVAPSDPSLWHTDPENALPRMGHFVVRPVGGDVPSPVFLGTPQDVLEDLRNIALATPRTQLLAGGPETGRMTFVTRSAVFGFPDYTTVAARPLGSSPETEGVVLSIHARLRFGGSDLGVNAARVRGWLAALAAARP